MAVALIGAVCLLWTSGDQIFAGLKSRSGGGVTALAAADVETLELRRGAEFIVARRLDGRWSLAEPAGAPADDALVTEVVQSALSLQPKGAFKASESGDSRESFGLEPPELAVVLRGAGRTFELRFGKLNRLSKRRYTEVAGPGISAEGIIFLVPDAQYLKVAKGRDDLRDRRPLRIDPSSVISISARRDGDMLTLDKHPPDGWVVAGAGESYPADAEVAAEIVRRLVEVKAEEFVAASAFEPAKYGFSPPALVIKLRLERGSSVPRSVASHQTETPEVTVEVGKVLLASDAAQERAGEISLIPELKKRYFFRLVGAPWVYQAPLAGPFDDLLREPLFFRDRAPFGRLGSVSRLRLLRPALPSFEVKHRGGELFLRKGSEEIRAEEARAGESGFSSELLSILGGIRALSYTGRALPPSRFDENQSVIEAYDEEGRFVQVVVGPPLGDEGQAPAGRASDQAPHQGTVRFGAEPALQAFFGSQVLEQMRKAADMIDQRLSQTK